MRQKAQTATEFIIIASIVLILVASVTAVMLRQPTATPTIAYDNNADIAIRAHNVNTTHALLTIQNNLRNSITLTQITLNHHTTTSNISLQPGQRDTIIANYLHNIDEQGRQYTIQPTVTYTTLTNRTITFPILNTLTGTIHTGPLQ